MNGQLTRSELYTILQITPPMGRGKACFLDDLLARFSSDPAGYVPVDGKGEHAPFLADLYADFWLNQGDSVVLDGAGEDVRLPTGEQTEQQQNDKVIERC